MNLIIVIVLLLILILNASSLKIYSNRIIIRKSYSKINVIPETIDDSSELDFESSSSIKEKRETYKLIQIEQENNIKALQKASREFLLKLETANQNSKPTPISAILEPTKQVIITTPTVSTTAVSIPPVSKSTAEGMSSSESKAFDAGLLVAFPFIVATLGLFLFFPFLRDNLTSLLPPLPSVEEMMKN